MERPFSVSEEVYPYESHWCVIDGIPVHYLDEGSGPVILLLHGNYMWSFSWRKVINQLKNEFRCIAIDLPGMGMSGKPHQLGMKDYGYTLQEHSQVVEAVLSRLQLTNITFVAYDHGGPIGLGVAIRQPDMFSKLMITNTWAWVNRYCGTYVMSRLVPRIPGLLRSTVTSSRLLGFESPTELEKPGVWDACVAPYTTVDDFKPITVLANQLTQAKAYYNSLNASLAGLEDKEIVIVWATKGSGLLAKVFAENIDEDKYFRRWQHAFPNARTELMNDVPYWFLSNPPVTFIETLRDVAAS
ncbi:MAG: alpha/beta fold hydrolase [Pseudomonadota bacterium]|nr:alpha/beta fold hydrolase [Pseudomonadota bacterium]